MGEREHYNIFRRFAMGCVQENKESGEEMIDEILNFLLGLVDHTYDNGSDAEKKVIELEREKIRYELKKLRRRK